MWGGGRDDGTAGVELLPLVHRLPLAELALRRAQAPTAAERRRWDILWRYVQEPEPAALPFVRAHGVDRKFVFGTVTRPERRLTVDARSAPLREGTMTSPDERHLQLLITDEGAIDPASREAFENWKERLHETGGSKRRVVLASHGGLVDEAKGWEFAGDVRETFNGTWTVTFITRTGVIETLHQQTASRLFRWLRGLIRRLVAALDDEAPESGMPVMLYRLPSGTAKLPRAIPLVRRPPATPSSVKRDALLRRAEKQLEELHREVPGGSDEEKLLRDYMHKPDEFHAQLDKAAAQARRQAQQRASQRAFPLGSSLGTRLTGTPGMFALYSTSIRDVNAWDAAITEQVIQELFPVPRTMWQHMKDRMEAVAQEQGAGWEVLRSLETLEGVQVTLLGHSLGGILTDHLLRTAEKLGALWPRVTQVIYLAPANTCTFALGTPQPLNARMFLMGLTDEEERNETGELSWPLASLYPRTLLYLIRNALEDRPPVPLLGMQRHLEHSGVLKDRFEQRVWVPNKDVPDQYAHGDFLKNPLVRRWISTLPGAS